VGVALSASFAAPAIADDDHPWGRWADCDEITERSIRHCSQTFSEWKPQSKTVRVDAGKNGSVSVVGWDKDLVRVQATLLVRADSEREAEELAARVQIRLERDLITVSGPERMGRDTWWSVSFRVWAPHESDLDLVADNGGIGVRDLAGKMRMTTHNGPLKLDEVAGEVLGRTRNGPLTVHLSGNRWQGKGLDVETHNGPVTLHIPEDYSAVLESGTRNGPWSVNLPVSVKRRTWFTVELGDGGSPVRVVTHNGPLSIK
jgi:hypothetical protein